MFTEWEKQKQRNTGPGRRAWAEAGALGGTEVDQRVQEMGLPGRAGSGSPTPGRQEQVVRAGRLSSAPCVWNSTDIPQITSTSRNQEQRELFSPLTDEVTEARGGEVTCSRSHLLQGRAKAIRLKSQPPHSILGERRGRLAGREAGRGDPPKSREATTNVKRRS